MSMAAFNRKPLRNLAQVAENAKAGELNLETADLARIRKDVIALGEPVKA
jgi:hypothetical protein